MSSPRLGSSSNGVTRSRQWKDVWGDVLADLAPCPEAPNWALCWALEQLCRAGVQYTEALLFVRAVWRKFTRLLGPQPAEPRKRTQPPQRAPQPAPFGNLEDLEDLEDLEEPFPEPAPEVSDYKRFCARVDVAARDWGDPRSMLVNVLGWALVSYYRAGFSDLTIADVILQTWEVVTGLHSSTLARGWYVPREGVKRSP